MAFCPAVAVNCEDALEIPAEDAVAIVAARAAEPTNIPLSAAAAMAIVLLRFMVVIL